MTGPSQSLVLVLASAILLLVLVGTLGWWTLAGFTTPAHWRDLRLYWLPVRLLAGPFVAGVRPIPADAVGLLLIAYVAVRYIVRADGRLVRLNILPLLCIAFQPFPTSVLCAYSTTPAVTFYAATLFVTGVMVLALWVYATRGRRLVSPNLDGRLIEHHIWRGARVPLVFLVSIGIAQVNPTAAEFSWLAVAVVFAALRWLYRART